VRSGTALLAAALAFAGCGGHSRPKPVKADAQGLPGYVVEADGHKVWFECEGEGSPTVVFLAGLGGDDSSWGSVFGESSDLTRSCEYDRYGLGLTATLGIMAPKPRDAHDQVRELEELLANGRIPKPYVLVGHSWGGTLARLYAGTHEDVEAVVFVESSTPDEDTALLPAVPPKRAGEPPVYAVIRTDACNPHPMRYPENLNWRKSLAEAGKIMSLGERPEIVITAGSSFRRPDAARVLFPIWLRLQNELSRLSRDSVHVLAPSSSHFVQTDAPDVVVTSIRAAVNAVRENRRLPPCAAIFRTVTDGRCLP
jgi:pimeloyl-ACP methyl ester carboxylesterase